jgi:hypothetical protein
MLSNSLSTSAKIADLYRVSPKIAEFCRCLFCLLVAHADDHGRLAGDEQTVKLKVDPITPRKIADFVAALHVMHEVGLITWYQVDDRKVIEITKFSEHQDLKGHEKRPWKLPPCPGPSAFIGLKQRNEPHWGILGKSGDTTKENLNEVKGSEGNLTQVGGDGDDRFDLFWSAYPKKAGKDAARKAFERRAVGDDLLARMLGAIDRQKVSRDWTKDGGQYIPHPATWLNAARWEDEPVVVGPEMSKATASVVEALKRDVTYD